MACTFTIASGLTGALAQKVDRRLIIGLSIVLAGAAIYLAGGTKFDNLAVTFVGLAFVGIFVSGIFVPMIPEILTSAEIEVKKEALKRAGGLDPNSLSEVV